MPVRHRYSKFQLKVRRQAGFTLVELMVAVLIGMILMLAVMLLQLKLTAQNVRTSDIALRDNEARAALDMMSRDLSSSGFLGGGIAQNCVGILGYNSNIAGMSGSAGYFASFGAWAMSGAYNTTLPFIDKTANKLPNGGYALNYPPSGSTIRSDVLLIRVTNDASNLATTSGATSRGTANATYPPLTQGAMPLVNTCNINAGDSVVAQLPISGVRYCMRLPVTSVVSPCGTSTFTASGTLMPSNFFAGFSAQMALLGGTANSLTNAVIWTGKYADVGVAAPASPAQPNQLAYAYYVDNTSSVAAWPRLVRTTINPLNDKVISNQELASGVVSMQVMFGVGDGTPADGVVSYVNPSSMTASQWSQVLSVKILLLTRSLYADPDKNFKNASSTIALSTQFPNANPTTTTFTDYPISTAEMSKRFVAQLVEVPVRNNMLVTNQ